MLKKIKALAIMVALLIGILPGVALAEGLVHDGLTLQGWVVGPRGSSVDGGPQFAGISFLYSDGFSTDIALSAPYDSSWKKINPVEPILLAYKEGYGPGPAGLADIFKQSITFAPNVLAAMKVQNFNPAQVGGANIPPESTVLNEEQIAWLQKGGYPIPAETPVSKPVETESAPITQAEPEPQKIETEIKAEPAVTPDPKPEAAPKAESSDPVGQTVQTPATAMTNEMVEQNKQLAAADPPKVNETKVSDDIAKQISEQKDTNNTVWIGVASTTVVLVALGGVYVKHKRV
ncbi:hypothetical protein [Desulfitobacterium hafniense]|uniref:hypothetical protein n=1 Tax=Desulfitobacterium hafniense TaxID=49338 RepID=UPI0003655EA2|nr:hypothetical protein [Desulfitobacterium hafniense]